jgi:DNA gyrase/topoisomerase IV subunit A
VDQSERSVLERRLSLLRGIVEALDRWDELSVVIADCEDRADALMRMRRAPFDMEEEAAEHLLDLSLARRTKAGRRHFESEIQNAESRLAGGGEPPAT